jgi:hypothetical protein
MKTRTLPVTFKEAQKWFKGRNPLFEELALKAYSKEELVGAREVLRWTPTVCTTLSFPHEDLRKFQVMANLATLAKYFNGSWRMEVGKTGFYLAKVTPSMKRVFMKELGGGIGILMATFAVSSGCIVFKSLEDAEKAYNLLEEDINYLF